ncbi:MAG: cell division protein ZapA [Pyrinomonadaceae bacterium]
MDESVQVRIFNQLYVLRSRNGSEHVTLIAQFVDERMRQIAAQITTYDVSKIAVLAALNIADELQAVKDQHQRELADLAAQKQQQEAQTIEEPPVPPAAVAEPQSWFDSIFDADEGDKPVRERRLSSQITAKLQSARHAEQQQQTPTKDEAE